MAYAMTKQGSLDNCVTYEFICDAVEDMNAIEDRYRTIGSSAIVLQGASGLEVYISGSDEQWNSLSSIGGGTASGDTAGLAIHICAQNEVSNGLPDVELPDETTIYLVPASDASSGNLYDEYIYVDEEWEKFGSGNINNYLPIVYNHIDDIIFEYENVTNTPAYSSTPIIIEDMATFPTGPAILQVGSNKYNINVDLSEQTWMDGKRHTSYYSSGNNSVYMTILVDAPVESATTTNVACSLIINDQNNTYNENYTVRLIFPGINKLTSTITEFYINTDINGENGEKLLTASEASNIFVSQINPHISGSLSMERATNSTVGDKSVALGYSVRASGDVSFAEGMYTQATGYCSHAEGINTKSTNQGSHSEGINTQAMNQGSHAEGLNTQAMGSYSHAEGELTTASGNRSHAEGQSTYATGENSHVFGMFNVADNYANLDEWAPNTKYQFGDKVKRTLSDDIIAYICNTDHTSSDTFYQGNWLTLTKKVYAEIVGNGNSVERSNAYALDWEGNGHYMGDIYVGCNADSTGGTKLPRIPEAPSTDGTYILQATVTNSTPTYTWVSLSSLSGVTF